MEKRRAELHQGQYDCVGLYGLPAGAATDCLSHLGPVAVQDIPGKVPAGRHPRAQRDHKRLPY